MIYRKIPSLYILCMPSVIRLTQSHFDRTFFSLGYENSYHSETQRTRRFHSSVPTSFVRFTSLCHLFAAFSAVSPHMGAQGWPFKNADPSWEDADNDPEHPNFQHVKDLYLLADPNYGGRYVYSPSICHCLLNRNQIYSPGAVGQEAQHCCQQRKL